MKSGSGFVFGTSNKTAIFFSVVFDFINSHFVGTRCQCGTPSNGNAFATGRLGHRHCIAMKKRFSVKFYINLEHY